jgi:hypothetical protein
MDLNELMGYYKVWGKGAETELKQLKDYLSDVPVSLYEFEMAIRRYNPSAGQSPLLSNEGYLRVMADTIDPQISVDFLANEIITDDEQDGFDEFVSKMVLPFPRLYIRTDEISPKFYNQYNDKLGELITPLEKDSCRILSAPDVGGICILFERDEKAHYIEIYLTKEKI